MAWAGFPKVSLGDIAGAVNKLQESVKTIEKNFDTALGLDQLKTPAPDGQDPAKPTPAKPSGSSPLDGWGWGSKAEPSKAPSTEASIETQAGVTLQSPAPVTAEIAPSLTSAESKSTVQSQQSKDTSPGQQGVATDKTVQPNLLDKVPVKTRSEKKGGKDGSDRKAEGGGDKEPTASVDAVSYGGTSVGVAEQPEADEGVPESERGKEQGTPLQEHALTTGAKEHPFRSHQVSQAVLAVGADGARSQAEADVNAPKGSADAPAANGSAANVDVKTPSEGVTAPTEPVILARIVEGVETSQPFGHGEGSVEEGGQKSPKMAVADAFPAAATPSFKPHAEVDSVADLTPSIGYLPTSQGGDASGEPRQDEGQVDVKAERKSSQDEGVAPRKVQDVNAHNGREESRPEVGAKGGLHTDSRHWKPSKPAEETGPNTKSSLEEPPGVAGFVVGNLQEKAEEKAVGLREGVFAASGKRKGGEDEAKELARLREELKGMEAALQHAAKQAQTKANELAEMGTVNDNLRAELEEVKRKKVEESDLDVLRAEYQHRLGTAERKVYALTKERDMLRRESSRKGDTSTLLKEKDEIIKQVMAEGEELSKKQAAVEGQMRKLRGTIRELEVERDRLTSRLQVEEAKTESIQKDKAKTERQLADAVERAQAELAAQKESYSAVLQETKEALAKAEAAADNTKRSELDKQVKEAAEREAELVRQLEEVREQLVRDAQTAEAREERLRRDVRELEARCQDAEARHSELIARVPDSTRPLLRQIEALQEAAASRAEAWGAVERTLNARVQEAEVATAGAQERERAATERLTQAASRMAVMEAQVSMLRAEQAALQRSLEKERARAAESRQELLALKEAAATHEGRAAQLDDELKALRNKHRKESQEAARKREALEQELDALRAERDKLRAGQASPVHRALERNGSAVAESGVELGSERKMSRRPSNVSSAGSSMEESYYLQASLQGAPFPGNAEGVGLWAASQRGSVSASLVEQLEAMLRQREGEIASYTSRLSSLESTRDALAEELVKLTQQSEELGREAALLPGLRVELDSLRRRHASALELMGERDEEVEELRADLHDHKSMYREQIDMLVKQIERQSKTNPS